MSKHRTKSSPREALFASGRRRFDRSRRVLAHASRPFDPRVSVGVRRLDVHHSVMSPQRTVLALLTMACICLSCGPRLRPGPTGLAPSLGLGLEFEIRDLESSSKSESKSEPWVWPNAVVTNTGVQDITGCLACAYEYDLDGCPHLEGGEVVCSHGPCGKEIRLVPSATDRMDLLPFRLGSCDPSQLKMRIDLKVFDATQRHFWAISSDWVPVRGVQR